MVKVTTNLLHGSIVGNQFTLTQEKDEPYVIWYDPPPPLIERTHAEEQTLKIEANKQAAMKRKEKSRIKQNRRNAFVRLEQSKLAFEEHNQTPDMKHQHHRRASFMRLENSKRAFDEMEQTQQHHRRASFTRLCIRRAFDEMEKIDTHNATPSEKKKAPARTPPSRPPCLNSRLRFELDTLNFDNDD
jgi:hypothetical protein